MHSRHKPHIATKKLIAVVVVALQCSSVAAQDCDELDQKALEKLAIYLEKTLDFELLKKKRELIEEWRSEYFRFDEISQEFTEGTKQSVLDQKKAKVEQAQNNYLRVLQRIKNNCPGD